MSIMNFERIFPHAVDPDVAPILYEPIDYNAAIGKRTNYGELGVDVLYKMLVDNVSGNTVVGGSSVWRNDIVKNDGSFRQMAIPYYSVQTSFDINAKEEAKFAKIMPSKSIVDFKKSVSVQAMAQRRAYIVFFGADASEAQGLFNASSETVSLPEDSASHSTLTSYIPGELLEFLVSQIRVVSDLSYNMLRPTVIVAPINAINFLKSKIVPLTNYQEKGAGTSSVAQVFENVVYDMNGMKVQFVPCSYMAGKGAGNTDVMLIINPGVEVKEENRDSTAYFNNFGNNGYVNTFMDDALELQEYQNPAMYQCTEWVMESIYTPGYTVRADAIRSIEYKYSE